jgi:hypothetical protein
MAALSEFVQDGIRYIPTKVAAKAVGLSPRYLVEFCRGGKIAAIWHKGAWYVQETSLRAYLDKCTREQEEYNRKLSEDAKREIEENARRAALAERRRLQQIRSDRRRGQRIKILTSALAALTFFGVALSGALAFQNIAPQKFAATLHAASIAPRNCADAPLAARPEA